MDFKLNRGMPGMPQVPQQLPTILIVLGATSAGFGLLLLINTWLLQYLVAGVFMLIGVALLMAGLRAKRFLG